jgi:hypothetical protein
MKTSALLKPLAICMSSALVLGLTFFTSGGKYNPRHQEGVAQNFGGAAEYYHWLKQDPATGKLNLEAMAAFQQEMAARYSSTAKLGSSMSAMNLSWSEMGPDNIGGRCRAILVDKMKTTRLFAGGVSGGLFRSDNNGNSWTPINDQLSTLIVSCIAQDGDGNIYFGTGEGMARGGSGDGNSAFIGGGIFKMDYNSATDSYSGATVLSATVPTPNSGSAMWGFVNRLKLSPVKHGSVYVIYAAIEKGLYVSLDGGSTFASAIPTITNRFAYDVDVCNDGSVYFSMGLNGSGNNKIYHSSAADYGKPSTFTDVTPATTVIGAWSAYGRIEIAASLAHSEIVYASVANPLNSTTGATLLGVVQSLDTGKTWTSIGIGSTNFEPFATYGQGDYDHVLEVFPDDDYSILLGGVDMFSWHAANASIDPSAGQWDQASFQGGFPTFGKYVHADKHAITFHPTDPNTFFIGCDGGVFRSVDRGVNFTSQNKGFNVTQFYALAFERDAVWSFGPSNGSFNNAGVFGGAQDNGTQYINGNGNTVKAADEINGGDGFYCEASMLSPNTFFSTSYYGLLDRTANRDANGASFYPGDRDDLLCPSTAKPGDGAFASFNTPIALYETTNHTNGVDSVIFPVDSIKIPNIKVANGVDTVFTFTITKPQASATIVESSIKIYAGNQFIGGTGTPGTLSGSGGSGTYTSANDVVSVEFNTKPSANTPIKVVAAISYASGNELNVTSNSLNLKFKYTLTQGYNTGDTIKIMDPIQSRLAIGMNGTVYMCKNPVNFSAVPNWVRIAGPNSVKDASGTAAGFSGYVSTLEWGGIDIVYAATTNGTIFRIKGLSKVINARQGDIDSVIIGLSGADSLWCPGGAAKKNKQTPIICEKIFNAGGRAITSIAVDPTNPDRVIVTLGNYGSTNHVYYSSDATICPFTTGTGTFNQISTFNAPVYSSTFIQTYYGEANPNRVLIGTEAGVYSIDLTSTGSGWESEGTNTSGLYPNVPTFMLKQQTLGSWECRNSGIIYAASHGRGFWQSKAFHSPFVISVPEIQGGVGSAPKSIKVFPNPAIDATTVNFNLAEDRKITISVYDLRGSKIKTVSCGKLNAGAQNINITLEGLAKGTYIVAVSDENDVLGTCRFVKMAE